MTLPDDYYAYPVAWKTLNGQKKPLTQIPHASWVQMPNRDATGDAVTHFYISPANVFYMWPVVSVDPVITLQYQRIVSDASSARRRTCRNTGSALWATGWRTSLS
jgi:hypothetical protein